MTSYGVSREQFILNAAIGAIKEDVLKVDFKLLSAMATIADYEDMGTPEEAKETFINELIDILANRTVPELASVCRQATYSISVSVSCGWRSAQAWSSLVVLGGKGYVYKCVVADPPGSKRQSYSPDWWADREIGKAKIMSRL